MFWTSTGFSTGRTLRITIITLPTDVEVGGSCIQPHPWGKEDLVRHRQDWFATSSICVGILVELELVQPVLNISIDSAWLRSHKLGRESSSRLRRRAK